MDRGFESEAPLPRPDRDRTGALVALILIAYGLVRLIELPLQAVQFELFGVLIRVDFDARFVMLTLAAALAASGVDWVLVSHSLRRPVGLEPRVLPGMAALGVGAILAGLPGWPAWPIGLALGGLLIFAVLYAEFVVWDPTDPRTVTASLGLRWLGILLTVGVAFAVRAGGLRAVFSVPLLFAGTGLVCWRLLELDRTRRSIWPYAVTAGWITAQLAWALHYWPLQPIAAALLLGLAGYVSIGLGRAHLLGRAGPRTVYEFGGVALAVLAAVLLLGQ
ncbi:MAG: DUF5656 family protein [Anaerolineales bacterium]